MLPGRKPSKAFRKYLDMLWRTGKVFEKQEHLKDTEDLIYLTRGLTPNHYCWCLKTCVEE